MATLRAGRPCDVIALEHNTIPPLVAEGLLAEIDFRNMPNFKNIANDFCDLGFDPGNSTTTAVCCKRALSLSKGGRVVIPSGRFDRLSIREGMKCGCSNRHSVPYDYGTTGLVVRSDLVGPAVTR